jgi:putative glutamine amidotransferase
LADHLTQAVTEKYLLAAWQGAGGLPLPLPALPGIAAEEWISRIDGLLLPGSRSNVAPREYSGPEPAPDMLQDRARDAAALPLIRAAIAADLPVLAICRGIQELNVALGGSLHQNLHTLPGRLDHRAIAGAPLDRRYAHDAHAVMLNPDGWFARLAGANSISVNSLHEQGIDRLAPGLAIEAVAPDGQIEGVRLPIASFVVGVQWHPEYLLAETPFSRALFAAFGDACRARAAQRRVSA